VAVDLQRRSDGANRREDELAPRRSNESVMAKAKALTTAAWKTQSPPDLSNSDHKGGRRFNRPDPGSFARCKLL
jgi:hypothetical protein